MEPGRASDETDAGPFLAAHVELKHGHHRYAFLVDGVLTLDPHAQGITRNDKGERVCLVPVSSTIQEVTSGIDGLVDWRLGECVRRAGLHRAIETHATEMGPDLVF